MQILTETTNVPRGEDMLENAQNLEHHGQGPVFPLGRESYCKTLIYATIDTGKERIARCMELGTGARHTITRTTL